MLSVAFVGAMFATTWSAADPVVPVVPGSIQEQTLTLPPKDADVAEVFKQLQSKEQGMKESALQWLLRREDAEKLAYFQTEAIRFHVQAVTQVPVNGQPWRLIECTYLARQAARSGPAEYRPQWSVAYVFDPRAQLRDWVDDYDLVHLQDINQDRKPELIAYIDSPKRVIVYSYEPGRSRELLRVDGVPSRGELLKSTPRKEGGESVTYEKPVEVIAGDATAARLKVAKHGVYKWDAKQQQYLSESSARK